MIRPLRRALAALPASLLLLTAAPAASAAPRHFALAMLHFNVQYVAGGLVGFLPLTMPNPAADLSAEQVEDNIVVESFEPVLDMLLAHPTWGTDIELQGYMLDVMAARHDKVLGKLRTLAKSGQLEVVSFHYSDQLFIAHPLEDLTRSQTLNRATFAKYDIPLSGAVFCQEGQAAFGMASVMKSAGYETLVFPKNLFGYQHGNEAPAPLYKWGDVSMITSNGIKFDDAKGSTDVQWWYVDDGELLATGKGDPYIVETFHKKPEAIAKYVADLSAMEAGGTLITTVSKYVATIKGDVKSADPPPLLDGTWQPDSTDGVHRWLGGIGLWFAGERDNDVRSLAAMAHRELLAAETIAKDAGLDTKDEIDAGFRLLALGEVSDATGINPFRGEVEYGIGHFTEALRLARDIIGRAKTKLGATAVAIDTAAGTVEKGATPPAAAPAVDGPLKLAVDGGGSTTDGGHTTDVTWQKLEEGHHLVTVRFGKGEGRTVSVTFPGVMGDLVYTPALTATPVHIPRSAFVFDHFELALADGLIGLGGGRFVIKDQANVHVSARIVPGLGDVEFHDDTMPIGETATWVFHVLDGTDAQAAALAARVNVNPKVWR